MKDVLPEEVRWRRDLGGHPGWKFYEQLIGGMAYHTPEIWNLERLAFFLNKWIDNSAISREWCNYAQSNDYATGYNIYAIAILAQWLRVHAAHTQASFH